MNLPLQHRHSTAAATRLLLVTLVVAAPLSGGWLRMASPHFELYTDAGEQTGRSVLDHVEQIRQVFLPVAGERGAPLPVRIFVFHSGRDYREYRPSEAAKGFYQGGPERDYIVMQDEGDEIFRVVFHEYVHLVLNHSLGPLPRWLEEGTADYFSTLQLTGSAGSAKLILGRSIPEHLHVLGSTGWMSMRDLAAVDRDSPYYNEAEKAGLFYAQSWAMVHMLRSSDRYRANFDRFTALLNQATPQAEAFQRAFGRSLEQAGADLKNYVASGNFPETSANWTPPADFAVETEQIDDRRAELLQSELLLRVGRPERAGDRLRKLSDDKRPSPEIETALGLDALADDRREEAMQHFQRAIDLGPAPATAYFEYAMLLRDRGDEPARVDELLAETVAHQPTHAEALFLIGLRASERGKYSAAIASFEKAVQVLPRQSYFWHALALAYQHDGRTDDARQAARKALEAAANARERDMALAALELTGAPAPEPAPLEPRPATVVPESWNMPKGDAVAEGTLDQIDCLGGSARLHIGTGGGTLSLWVDNPARVQLRQAGGISFEFSCGVQKPQPVRIEYLSRRDADHETVGEVTAIEFRN